MADLAQIQIVGDKPLDGVSIRKLLLTDSETWPSRMIFSHQRGRVSVRTQRYRLDHTGKLFDMKTDPRQNHDFSKERPRVTERLSKAVAKWKDQVLPGSPKDDRPFPVGYPEFPTTFLPARDGIPHGNVRRSARSPNCSYFTNWISADDRITWDVEVANAGDFEAVVYYTCPAKDIGSTFELSFDKSSIRAMVTEAHDPPLVGAEFDRCDRGSESFVKDFRPLRLGRFRLEKGRGELVLWALNVPGGQVMDVRSVRLTLLR